MPISSSDAFSPGRRRFLAGLAASLLLAGCSRRPGVRTDPGVSYYTCAMHPSVRSHDAKGKCPICGMTLVPVPKEAASSEGPGPGQGQGQAPTHSFTLAPEQAALLGVASTPLAWREAVLSLRAPGRATTGRSVTASFFAEDAGRIAVGQSAEVAFDLLPDVIFPGRIAAPPASPDAVSHLAAVRLTLDKTDPRIVSDSLAVVRVSIPLGRRLIAPLAAILPTGERHVVVIDRGNGTMEPRYVVTGLALPDGWEIVSGAEAGDRLVTSANFLVEAQARIEGALRGRGEIR